MAPNIQQYTGGGFMRLVFKFMAWLVGAIVGITTCAIALELLTGKHDPFIQSIFGLIGGAIGWILVGKKKSADDSA